MHNAPIPPAPISSPAGSVAAQRARGRADVTVVRRDGRVRLARLYQQGCAKALLPRPGGPAPEAVLINTAGGLTGGDRIAWHLGAGEGAALVVTTQAAERVYRSTGGAARVDTRLTLGPGARLDWLPQETILFDAGRLERRLTAEMAEDATLLAAEIVVLGRAAHGETVRNGAITDHWRLHRAGRLVHAEALRLEGDIPRATRGPATLQGARAFATVVLAGPAAALALPRARAALEAPPPGLAAAAGAKGEDLLIARMVGAEAQALRGALIRLLMVLRDGPLPRVWTT